jgi:hypothetical protein
VLRSKLTGAQYHPDNTSALAREIADEIKQHLKGAPLLQLPRSCSTSGLCSSLAADLHGWIISAKMFWW